MAGNKRPFYRRWLAALDEAAAAARKAMSQPRSDVFSLRVELRLYAAYDQGSDLDNYIKPNQDALARHGVFGETVRTGSSMTGDERIDHLEVRRKRASSDAETGVVAEVWALTG